MLLFVNLIPKKKYAKKQFPRGLALVKIPGLFYRAEDLLCDLSQFFYHHEKFPVLILFSVLPLLFSRRQFACFSLPKKPEGFLIYQHPPSQFPALNFFLTRTLRFVSVHKLRQKF